MVPFGLTCFKRTLRIPTEVKQVMQFEKDKAKPYTFSLVGFKGWLHITKQKNSGSRWKNTPIPALTLCKALPFCPQAHYKSLSQEQGGNRSSHASCVLVLFPPDLFNPVIPAFSHEKWPSAHRPCPRSISTPLSAQFSCELYLTVACSAFLPFWIVLWRTQLLSCQEKACNTPSIT